MGRRPHVLCTLLSAFATIAALSSCVYCVTWSCVYFLRG